MRIDGAWERCRRKRSNLLGGTSNVDTDGSRTKASEAGSRVVVFPGERDVGASSPGGGGNGCGDLRRDGDDRQLVSKKMSNVSSRQVH